MMIGRIIKRYVPPKTKPIGCSGFRFDPLEGHVYVVQIFKWFRWVDFYSFKYLDDGIGDFIKRYSIKIVKTEFYTTDELAVKNQTISKTKARIFGTKRSSKNKL